jgi:succinate-acetate transporter protein
LSPTKPVQQPEPVDGQAPVDLARIVLRPIASSAPVGFYAFGVGTIVYTALELRWIPDAQISVLALVLLCFSAPLQLVAGLIAYTARDAGLATAMTIFGMAWVTIGVTSLTAPAGSRSAVLGIFMLVIAVIVAAIGAGAVRTRPLLSGLAGLAFTRYALTGIYQLTGLSGFERVSGWVGVPIVLISVYGGTAFLLEDTTGRTILPLGRRNAALVALQGGLGDQLGRIAQEAGVRHQL